MNDKRDPITGQAVADKRTTAAATATSTSTSTDRRVLLILAQRPEQELNALLQILSTQGIGIDQAAAQQRGTSWPLRTTDGRDAGRVALMPELGVFRVLLQGERAAAAEQLVSSYLPVMQPDSILAQADTARSTMEQQVYGVMAVLAFADAQTAMASAGNRLLATGKEALQQGVVQGLLLIESADASRYLEQIAREHVDKPLGDLARRGLAMLAERGLASETPETLVTRAQAALDKGEHEEALELVAVLLEMPEPPSAALLIAAKALRALGRPDDVVRFVPRPPAGPGAAEILTERGLAFERLGRLQEAWDEVRLALELEPDLNAAKNARQRLELQRDRANQSLEEQLASLDAAIEQNPQDGALYLQRAQARLQSGRALDALSDLTAAEKARVEDTATLETVRAEAALTARHYAEALRAATRAQANADALPERTGLLRGRAFLALDEPERAANAFAKTRREEPRLAAEASLGRAIALELLGRADDARKDYQEALSHGHKLEPLLARLKPITYKPTPILTEIGGRPLEPQPPASHKLGDQQIDALFKVCLECGSPALARRTSCRDCGGRDFVR